MKRATAAASFSVSFTVGLYGIAFGAAGTAAGFSILQTCLLSLLTFSGASQFAVVGVLGAGGSAISGIATASLLGIRNSLYGLRLAPLLHLRGWKKIVGAQVTIDESSIRSITWPTTQIFGLAIPSMERDLVIVTGVEPSMRWKSFSHELLDLADDLEVSLVITLGSLLADTPHTRPITVTSTGAHPNIAERLGVAVSKYEGPTGILGIIQDGCMRRGIDAISLWAAVPHYASGSPSPKASLALINSIEDFLDISIPLGTLSEDSDEWEKSVDDLAAEDSDVAEYVKALEESKDAAELPDVSGDSIAKEFERYLRRRGNN